MSAAVMDNSPIGEDVNRTDVHAQLPTAQELERLQLELLYRLYERKKLEVSSPAKDTHKNSSEFECFFPCGRLLSNVRRKESKFRQRLHGISFCRHGRYYALKS